MDTQKIEQLKEYAHIIKDTPYALRTYLKTFDKTQGRGKFVPFQLFEDQVKLVKALESHIEIITKKYRQAGVTSVTAAWISKLLTLASKDSPEKILIVGNKRETAIEMANKIRGYLEQWPDWIRVDFDPNRNSESRFKLLNGCEVKAIATSSDALRNYTPTILVLDEAAFIEAGEAFWSASMASLSCVHEDTYIFTSNGIFQLKEIINEKTKIGFAKYEGELSVINKNLEISKIKNTFKSEKSICYKIKTKSGYELIGSFKHPVLKNLNNGNDDWTRLENLNIGDNIKFQYNQNLFGKDNTINFKLKHFNELEKFKLPKKLNENLDLCYLMGLYIAEGSYTKNIIQICNGDKEIEKFLLSFGFTKNRDYHFYFCSSYLQRFFIDYIGIKKNISHFKEIPNLIFKSSKNVIISFLQGMFDGDGCSNNRGIKYSSTSKKLVNQLQILLLNFGIKSYIRYNENKTSKNSILSNKEHITKIYNLYIKNEDVLKFYNNIGFRLERKQENKKYFLNKIKNKSFIYATKNELKSILKENEIKRSVYEKEYRFLDLLMRKNKNHITINGVEKLLEKKLKNKSTLNSWIKRYKEYDNYFYDEIIEISRIEDETYDLEIPNGNSFITNGIISHNTGGKVILISCVTKDTYVFTNNGLQQVSDFIIEDKNIGEGYDISQYNILGKNKLRTSNLFLNNGKNETLEIYTVNSILEGTKTHKLWAYSNKENKYDWYKLSDLLVGDFVNINYNFDLWGNKDEIDFNYTSSSKESNIFTSPIKMTKELSYILGLFIAEGSSYKVFNKNEEFIGGDISITCGDNVGKYINDVGLSYTIYDKFHYKISSKSFYSFLEYIGFDLSLKAKNKIIPKRLLSLSKENIKYLLMGIFDGDGYSDKTRGRVGINLSSKILVEQIKMLLLNFGILTDLNVFNCKPTKKVKKYSLSYRISCDRHNSKLFYEKIGFLFERKQKNYEIVKKYSPIFNNSQDIIPNGCSIIKNIMINNGIKRKNLNSTIKKLYDGNIRSTKKHISRRTFEMFIDYFKNNSISVNVDKIFFENSKWVKIKKIEESFNETYDFSLYNENNDFWCHSIFYNGFLGHQTPNGHDPIYYAIYDQSIRGLNDFYIVDLIWFKDPRYNKDLKWVKCDDIVHYMLNREQYNDDEDVMTDFDLSKYQEYLDAGYKPFSSWFQKMSKKFKYDRRRIAQELECLSGNTLITVRNKLTKKIKTTKIFNLYKEL